MGGWLAYDLTEITYGLVIASLGIVIEASNAFLVLAFAYAARQPAGIVVDN